MSSKSKSFLLQNKTKQTFFEKLSVKSKSTSQLAERALTNFERFIALKYPGKTLENIITELSIINDFETACVDLVQDWINQRANELNRHTIQNYYGYIGRYLRHRGIKISKETLNENLIYPQKIEESRHPLSKEEYKMLVDNAIPERKALYLVLGSSGMRIGECCALRKKDFDHQLDRIRITIPAKYTKTKKSRVVFISKEAERFLDVFWKNLDEDTPVFSTNKDYKQCVITEMSAFHRLREKVGLTQKYEESDMFLISSHCFRAWFFTKSSRLDISFAHMMTGHKQYLDQYDRLTDKEKLDLYLQIEPELMVYEGKTELVYDEQKDKELEFLRKEYSELKSMVFELAKRKQS